jgi:signal transduction histidine kinase/ActR/RegA family two-component response regulator
MTPATSLAAWLRVRLEPPRSNDSGEQPQDLAWWRGRILHAVLVAAAGLGTVAYVPSVALCLRERLWVMAATDTIAWIGMLSLLAAPRLSYEWRARGVIAIVYILPVLLIAEVAMPGAGLVWFCVFPILAAILLGLRAAVISLVLFALTCAIFALAIAADWWSWLAMPASPALPASPVRDLWVWIVDALNALLVSGMAALATAALLRGLESTNRSLIDATAERERSEAERGRLEAQLRQAQKLEAVGRLAGGIAHDFNNLLMPMLVYTDEVRRELPPGGDAWERLGEVLQSAERARSLVQRILMFSRRTVAARAPVRVDAIVREAGGLLRAAIPSMIEIRYALATTRTVVIADAAELHQVIMNLGTNAAYAMRGTGGHLTFHVDEVDGGRLVRLRVIDTGAGMDAATLERAFEPFFTTKPVGEGSGLGLAAVHGIITSLGGQITLTSRPGLGTTVEMLLPRHVEHVEHVEHGRPVETAQCAGASASSRSEPIVLRGARQRVLVVDDEPSVLAACHQLLDRLNYEVVACAHPAQALELLRKQPSAIDVLLTDQAMPHMTGPALAEAARRVRPDLPVVLATGFLDEKIRHAVEAIGIDQVLCKPYTVADLSAALSAALETRTRV